MKLQGSSVSQLLTDMKDSAVIKAQNAVNIFKISYNNLPIAAKNIIEIVKKIPQEVTTPNEDANNSTNVISQSQNKVNMSKIEKKIPTNEIKTNEEAQNMRVTKIASPQDTLYTENKLLEAEKVVPNMETPYIENKVAEANNDINISGDLGMYHSE